MLLGLFQMGQQARAQEEALRVLREGGLSPEEIARMREEGEAAISRSLAQRGLMDSGLLPGAKAALEGELALAQARARAPFRLELAQRLMGQAQQPTLLSTLVPMVLRYGLKGPKGDWWIEPAVPEQQPVVIYDPKRLGERMLRPVYGRRA